MPEVSLFTSDLTAAEAAVLYCLERVVQQADFRHYMLHTETLSRLIEAEAAARRGVERDEVDGWLQQRMIDRGSIGLPHVMTLQEDVARLTAKLSRQSRPSFSERECERLWQATSDLVHHLLHDAVQGQLHASDETLRELRTCTRLWEPMRAC